MRMTRRSWIAAAGAGSAGAAAAAVWAATRGEPAAAHAVEVVAEFPHDSDAFCQGLVFEQGRLYESTGRYGQSSLREVELESGKVLRRVNLRAEYFGEGIAAWKDSIVQLTWRNGAALVFDRADLKYRRSLAYSGEGWGLTHDGREFFMSDGTSTLRRLDPDTFRQRGALRVRDRGRPVPSINELEYVEGEIYANVWQTDRIVRISPQSGDVLGWIDASSLRARVPAATGVERDENVLNGIAYDAAAKRLFLTGKLWPKLFEVRIVAKS
jgi:glutaminyl-peptide cyclotransferase